MIEELYFIVDLICIFLISNEGQHLFVCLLLFPFCETLSFLFIYIFLFFLIYTSYFYILNNNLLSVIIYVANIFSTWITCPFLSGRFLINEKFFRIAKFINHLCFVTLLKKYPSLVPSEKNCRLNFLVKI